MRDQLKVNIAYLRPEELIARRSNCPAAYIPIGVLEWHGQYNPLGLDGLQAEGLAHMCAQKAGGVVFPTMFYGESRAEALLDTNAATRGEVAEGLQVEPRLLDPSTQLFTEREQTENFQRLLLHVISQAASYGFIVITLVVGHAPLIDHATAACLIFNQRSRAKKMGVVSWACFDALLLQGKFTPAGDHAGPWETSHMLHLHPGTVDLKIASTDLRKKSSAVYGKETLEAAQDVIIDEVQARLKNPSQWLRHGRSFSAI